MVEIEKLNYDDITVIPDIVTDIESRKECNPYDENGYLPIFASPMTSVVSIENAEKFNEAKIYAVIPRSYSVCRRIHYLYNDTHNFVAFSLKEVEDYFLNSEYFNSTDCGEDAIEVFDVKKVPYNKQFKICIDLANGHMKCLLELVAKLKEKYGERIAIMTGNVANPKTYELYEKAGVDYLRAGIGGGSLCVCEGTEILMADGSLQKIESIDKGDYVSTINGNKRVLNTFSHITKNIISINEEIQCMPEHKFFVLKKTDAYDGISDEEIKQRGIYVEAKDLTDEYLLVKA